MGTNYGWVVVAAVIVISAISVAMAGPVVSFFIAPMQADLGLLMLTFGLALSARQLGFAVIGPMLGKLTDTIGARTMLMAVGVLSAAIVYSLSFVQQDWHLLVLLCLLGAVGLQGAGGDLYGSVVIAKWFGPQQRGKAMSLAFLGLTIGIFVFMPLSEHLVDTLG